MIKLVSPEGKLEVLADNTWSHCQEAAELSLELIASYTFGEYKMKPILAYNLSMKKLTGIGSYNSVGEAVARVSEYTCSSGQMDHYNLKMAMAMFVDICNKHEVEDTLNKLGVETIMLDIVIDGDM
eukprot:868392-Ditylum_brightwellii.AAC.1